MTVPKIKAEDKEKRMISSLETAGYEAIDNEILEIQRYIQNFRESGNKLLRVNIRLTERDVEKAQALATREGIPYSTLLTSILHKYFTGRLKEA